ncbi:MAG: hypothetical protein KDD47_28645, partial [Acidobacteria bacterium]|nr:hypothetical protein [Acidobacteriota bacterium]
MKPTKSLSPWKAMLLSLFLAAATALPAIADGQSVLTRIQLLVGFPSAEGGDSPGVLVAPGTVLPIEATDRGAAEEGEASQGSAEAFFDLAESLKRTVRLESVDGRYKMVRPLALDEPTQLPAPSSSSPISLSATLLGYSRELASYRVQFTNGDEVLADTRVAVKRGGRTVVGGLDGEDAPYLFLVLEPLSEGASQEIAWLAEGITPPRSLSKVQP